ncbi:hypothetical protein SAMN04487914_108111 [Arthrobacter sp. ok909]|nr:hypothetical protein SAMN04487914_108111 [Arthrobacter sp. ok909]
MFNKDIYRKNREAGQRGQGAYPNLIVGIDATPATSVRGLGLRKRKPSATKHSKFNTVSWGLHKAAVAAKVSIREAVAKQHSAERKAKRQLV